MKRLLLCRNTQSAVKIITSKLAITDRSFENNSVI